MLNSSAGGGRLWLDFVTGAGVPLFLLNHLVKTFTMTIKRIPYKYKQAHYSVNRFKPIAEIITWFEREQSIYDVINLIEICQYFVKKCSEDLVNLSCCSDHVPNREQKIINTANCLRYCQDFINDECTKKLVSGLLTTV